MGVHSHRAPLSLLPSQSTLINNARHYNFADDDTPIKYPLAIGLVERSLKQPANVRNGKRVTFSSTVDDDDDDIAPTVTEMDMLEEEEDNEPNKNYSYQSTAKRPNTLSDNEYRKRSRPNNYDSDPARRE